MENRQHWQDWIMGIVGIWLIASPWVLNFATVPAGDVTTMAVGAGMTGLSWNFIISGLVALLVAGSALTAYRQWEEWIGAALGLWLIASPWVIQFTELKTAFWSATASGVVVLIAAAWNLFEEQQAGHA